MSVLTLFLIALGVSADAFAVAVGKGLQMRRLRVADAVLLALVFGVFQALMPALGYLLGTGFADRVAAFDHWIAFALLAAIGGKMIWEAFHGDADGESDDGRIPVREMLVLGLATSIDALAVGIGFAFLDVDLLGAVLLIGVTTFVISLGGVALGHRAGTRFQAPAEVVGGLILIGIGLRIVLDHTGVL